MAFLDRFFGWSGDSPALIPAAAPALARPSAGPVQAFTGVSLDDPALAEFLKAGWPSATGVSVNDRVALRNSTFFRSVFLIAGAMGMLPTHLMEQDEDGGNKRKAKGHSLYRKLHKRPNRYQTAAEFKSYMQTVALLDGNAYAMVVKSGRNFSQLVPLPRGSVKPELTDTFDIRFKYQRPSGGTIYLSSSEVFHFRHPISLDGLTGVSLKTMAAETIGIASIAERAAGKLFKNGAFAGGTLETDKAIGDDVHQRLSESWEEVYSGAENSGKWPILEEGLKAKPFGTNAKEAQHLETREHQAEEIARFSGVPRPLLMFDETSWGSGIEQLGLFFVTYCLMPWFTAWEQAIERILDESEQDRFYVKFNEGALLRGSLKDQAEFFAKALGAGGGWGWMRPNEVRESFDRNPVEDGNELPRPSGAAGLEVEDDVPPAPPPPKRRRRSAEEDD
ncbi:MAG: phage portal protein [Allosphingosinicella sp.]